MRFATANHERVSVREYVRVSGSTHVLWLFTTDSFALKIEIAGNYSTNKALKKLKKTTHIHIHTIMHAHTRVDGCI